VTASEPAATPVPTTAAASGAATTALPEATPYPEGWMNLPVIPEVSDTARDIYAYGRQIGRSPHSFSVVGDCQATLPFFLGSFDRPDEYRLGEYSYLQDVIDNFAGSFYRPRYAVGPGCTVASVLSPLWADPSACAANERPLDCEFRVHNPSIVIITMERKDYRVTLDTWEYYLQEIVGYAVQQGVVPILATKADNLEGDYSINQTIVRVAQDYDVPVWNFWREVQTLPYQGLRLEYDDEFHLTFEHNYFDDPEAMQYAWPHRNLTALQALDAVWRGARE
jgi:hypothetical protein